MLSNIAFSDEWEMITFLRKVVTLAEPKFKTLKTKIHLTNWKKDFKEIPFLTRAEDLYAEHKGTLKEDNIREDLERLIQSRRGDETPLIIFTEDLMCRSKEKYPNGHKDNIKMGTAIG